MDALTLKKLYEFQHPSPTERWRPKTEPAKSACPRPFAGPSPTTESPRRWMSARGSCSQTKRTDGPAPSSAAQLPEVLRPLSGAMALYSGMSMAMKRYPRSPKAAHRRAGGALKRVRRRHAQHVVREPALQARDFRRAGRGHLHAHPDARDLRGDPEGPPKARVTWPQDDEIAAHVMTVAVPPQGGVQ